MIQAHIPIVSVVMTVYNGARYIAETIECILQQTFSDFEFIIVDDGSTDATGQILQHYAALDRRICLLHNEQNQGISMASNRALAVTQGRYIAITDADDLSMPERLQKQVAFLDEHPAIGVVSTRIRQIDPQGQALSWVDSRPTQPALVQWALFFRCCVAHGSAMVRQCVYQQTQGYDSAYDYGFDYAFWLRVGRFTQIANLPERLLAVRVHAASASQRYRQRQDHYALLAQQRAISTWLGRPIALEVIRAFSHLDKTATLPHAYQAAIVLGELHHAYAQTVSLSTSEQRQIQHNVNKQRCYLLFKAMRLPQLAASALGGNFNKLNRFANFMRY